MTLDIHELKRPFEGFGIRVGGDGCWELIGHQLSWRIEVIP